MTVERQVRELSDIKRLALRMLLEKSNIGRQRSLEVTGSNLRILRAGAPILFIYPATDGSVGYMRHYLPYVPAGWGVYALQTPGLDDDREPYRTVEAIAAHGLEQIRSVQPAGPYYVAGNCMGGLPAYETATQLQAQAAETMLLLHLMPNFDRQWQRLPSSTDDLQLRAVVDYVFIIERLLKVRVGLPVDRLARLSPQQRFDVTIQHVEHHGLPPLDRDIVRRRMDIYRANLEAMLTYAPSTGFRGTLTVLAAGIAANGEDTVNAMSPYAAPLRTVHRGRIDTIFVDADGGALFDGTQPHMSAIGVQLRRIIEGTSPREKL